jgi:outer membrane lipoprotein SlyB
MRTVAMSLIALTSVATLAGCAPSLSGNVYSREQARSEQPVRIGVVESVREVRIEGTRSGVGATAGAIIGGIAGSSIGHGRTAQVGSVVGAVAGGVAGQAGEQVATGKTGLEITVRLDSGQLIAIVQEADEAFRPGDRVRVLRGHDASRVTH